MNRHRHFGYFPSKLKPLKDVNSHNTKSYICVVCCTYSSNLMSFQTSSYIVSVYDAYLTPVLIIYIGTTDNGYAVYDLIRHTEDKKKTLTSPTITAGRYCLGFWYYKTGSSSLLTVSLISTNNALKLWNANNAPLKAWTYTTVEVTSDKRFQVSFFSF